MARKHEIFNYNYGFRTAPEQWTFYYNGKPIPLDGEKRNSLALLCLQGKTREAEDELKRLLRKEEKQKSNYITFGFYGKNSKIFYYTKDLLADGTILAEKLEVYKAWKRYIKDDCNGYLRTHTVTNGFITPYGAEKNSDKNMAVLIDTNRRGVIIRIIKNHKNKLFRVYEDRKRNCR